jgi:uncharacterized protein (TIGR02588 family)
VERKPGTSVLEWVVAGISLLILAAAIFYLLTSAFTDESGPTQIAVRTLGVTPMEDSFVVEFAAESLAGDTVAAVEIRGELRDGDEAVEEASVTLDYLPKDSRRTGALIFRIDPADHELVLSAKSYATP